MICLVSGGIHATGACVFLSLVRHAGSAINSAWGHMESAKENRGIHLISVNGFE
jgi:hypothetical protein